jgi:signal transduction histidine kinase
LLVALTAAPLALRRAFPLTAFWTIMSAAVAAYYGNNNATLVTFLAVAFAAYSAVVHSRYRGAALLSMPLVTVLLIALSANMSPPIPARATPLLIFIPIMIVGDAVHRWARRAVDSGARLRQAQAEHEAATRRALARERARLASELHDVVTHNVSVMVVQAGAARRVLSADPAEAINALRAVESSGRTAMTELRHLLGLLSPPPGTDDAGGPAGQPAVLVDAGSGPGGAADLAPQPGLDELREMVGRVVAAGLPVELRIAGTPRDLPAGLGLAVYRVVQEALTNVIKHAGKPQAEVRLTYEPAALVVEVADDGRPIPAAGPALDAGVPRGAGMGLLGLRERVALYGGELAAAPRPGGGWLVQARIPVEPAEIPAEVTPP